METETIKITMKTSEATELYLFLNAAILPWIRSYPDAALYQVRKLLDVTEVIGEALKEARKGERNG